MDLQPVLAAEEIAREIIEAKDREILDLKEKLLGALLEIKTMKAHITNSLTMIRKTVSPKCPCTHCRAVISAVRAERRREKLI
jgi:hypothetical protein